MVKKGSPYIYINIQIIYNVYIDFYIGPMFTEHDNASLSNVPIYFIQLLNKYCFEIINLVYSSSCV